MRGGGLPRGPREAQDAGWSARRALPELADGGGDAAAAAHAGAAKRELPAALREGCWPVPLWTSRSAWPGSLRLQLSLKKVCADFTMLCHNCGACVSAKEVRQFCVWRAPVRFLAGQRGGQLEPCTPHRVLSVLQHCYMYRCVKRVLERDGWRTLYRGEARQKLPP